MPRITIHAVNSTGEPRRWTLSERIVADNLTSDHYTAQLIERLAWATADAEVHESQADERAGSQPSRSLAAARSPTNAAEGNPAVERLGLQTRSAR